MCFMLFQLGCEMSMAGADMRKVTQDPTMASIIITVIITIRSL